MPKGEVLTLNGNRVAQDSRLISKCNPNQIPCWSLIIKETRESDTGFYVCQNNEMQTSGLSARRDKPAHLNRYT